MKAGFHATRLTRKVGKLSYIPYCTSRVTRTMDTLNKSNSFRIIAENENLHETFLGIGVFVLLISVVGLVENLCVLYVFIKHKPMPVSNNSCLMWLTLIDIGLTIFGLPLLVGSSFAETWPYGQPVCAMYGFFMTFFGISQIAFLDIIAIEKYLIIVKQNRILSNDGKTRTVSIFCCFCFGLMWAVFPLLGWNSFTFEGLQISCSVNWAGRTTLDMSYSLSLMVFAWVVPLVVMLFCYGNIVILVSHIG